MAINCGAGWQRDALEEALGRPDEDTFQPDSSTPGSRLHILRWRCGADAFISAVKGIGESGYTIEVGCHHTEHHDVAQLPNVRVRDVTLVDAAGASLKRVPRDLHGVRLKFFLDSPVRAYARVEVAPDLNTGFPKRLIEVDGGLFGPGNTAFELELTREEKLDDPVQHELELSIHVVSPKTAARDRNADGICLWSADYFV